MNRKATNPFYPLLVVVGVVFVITACGYAVMAVHGLERAGAPVSSTSGRWFIQFMEHHGFTALMVELAVLALATFGAIGTDDYWIRRAKRQDHHGEKEPPDADSENKRASNA